MRLDWRKIGPGVAVIMAVAMVTVHLLPSALNSDRMTREQLHEAARTEGNRRYEYRLSYQERTWIQSRIHPYDCGSGIVMRGGDEWREYACGLEDFFTRDEGDFIPEGYRFGGAVLKGNKLISITIEASASPATPPGAPIADLDAPGSK